MGEIKEADLVFEFLLNLYFMESRDKYLNDETIKKLDEFMKMCQAKDMFDNTQITRIIEAYYSIDNGKSKKERRSQIGLSDAALYRFRLKIMNNLKNHLNASDVNNG